MRRRFLTHRAGTTLLLIAAGLFSGYTPTALTAVASPVGTAIEHSRSCGDSIRAGQHTSCGFARLVKRAWYRHPRSIERVYSPITRKTYAMHCQPALGTVHCLGPHGVFASFPNIGFGP